MSQNNSKGVLTAGDWKNKEIALGFLFDFFYFLEPKVLRRRSYIEIKNGPIEIKP